MKHAVSVRATRCSVIMFGCLVVGWLWVGLLLVMLVLFVFVFVFFFDT